MIPSDITALKQAIPHTFACASCCSGPGLEVDVPVGVTPDTSCCICGARSVVGFLTIPQAQELIEARKARAPFRAGDHVHHRPSDEKWVLAADQDPAGDVVWCGWPDGQARAINCDLIRAATDEERLAMLQKVSKANGGSYRSRLAKHQLEAPARAAAAAERERSQGQFIESLRTRLNQGAKDYGEKSFSRHLPDLLGELEQELLDQAGWAYVGWCRIQRLKAALAEAERQAPEDTTP